MIEVVVDCWDQSIFYDLENGCQDNDEHVGQIQTVVQNPETIKQKMQEQNKYM